MDVGTKVAHLTFNTSPSCYFAVKGYLLNLKSLDYCQPCLQQICTLHWATFNTRFRRKHFISIITIGFENVCLQFKAQTFHGAIGNYILH